jgi:hypothetical protein
MESSDALRALRHSFYECLNRRSDALFELTDAMLTADSAVPWPAHLSLQPAHRRGWGSLYAALDRGLIDAEALRKLLACHLLASGGADEPLVFAVDASVWPRCDAETSPERSFYYHPSRHSAGQPIVACSGPTSSWHSLASPARVGPPLLTWSASGRIGRRTRSPQSKSGLCWVGSKKEGPYRCSSLTRATTPSNCSVDSKGAPARSSSACGQDAASTATPASASHPHTSDVLAATGPR